MGNVLNNIGLIYIDNEKPLLAINYHRKALALYTKRGDNYNVRAVSTSDISLLKNTTEVTATIEENGEEFDSSQVHLQKA